MFSGRTRGGYDWITHQAFLSEEMADEGSDIFRNLFGDIIQTYEVYDFIRASEASFILSQIQIKNTGNFG